MVSLGPTPLSTGVHHGKRGVWAPICTVKWEMRENTLLGSECMCSPQIHILTPHPKMMVLRLGLWRITKSQGQSLPKWDLCSYKKQKSWENLLAPFCPSARQNTQKVLFCEEQALTRHKSAGRLILNFPTCRTMSNKLLLFISCLMYLIWQPEWIRHTLWKFNEQPAFNFITLKHNERQAWWHMPVITSHCGRLRLEDYKFKPCLGNLAI